MVGQPDRPEFSSFCSPHFFSCSSWHIRTHAALELGIRSNAHSIFLVLQVDVYKQTVSAGISYYRYDILTRHSNRHFELKTFLRPIYNSLCFSRPTWQNPKKTTVLTLLSDRRCEPFLPAAIADRSRRASSCCCCC